MLVPQIVMAENGPELSRIVFGAWRLSEWNMEPDEVRDLVFACVDLGITSFDHADIYGGYTCEVLFGDALAGESALRDRIQLVTKCGIKLVHQNRPEHTIKQYDTSRGHIVASVESSLRALRTDYVDLLLLHRPDPLMHADEVAEAFQVLHTAGKVLYFGVSNFTPSQFALLQSRLEMPLVTNQVQLSVLHADPIYDGTLDHCQRLGISPMAWSPFGGGALFKDESERAVRMRAALAEVGDALGGASIDQVALAWLLALPSEVVPVLGTGKLERVRAAAGAEALRLTRDQWFQILKASSGADVP